MAFEIDTGDTGGSRGPWINWTSEGSARKGLAPESWVLRYKDDGMEVAAYEVVPAFTAGCVMDLDSLKLGWEKDGGKGVAPERRWNPSLAAYAPRPSEDRNPQGKMIWGKALSVRCAIGGGKAATWEQASFGAFEAFNKLKDQIVAQWAAHSQNGAFLPLVKQTSVERRSVGVGSTSIPHLEIVKWVPRPDCLKDDAPQIMTMTPAPKPAQAPVAPAAVIPEDSEF